MNKQQGFTLVELVIVIVLLGILAATVAPRFIGMQGSAHAAVLQTTAASIDSASKMVYAKAVVEGKQGEDADSVNIGGDAVNVVYGFPQGSDADLQLVVDDLDTFQVDETTPGTVYYVPNDYTLADSIDPLNMPCHVSYIEATGQGSNNQPIIEAHIDGC